MRLKNKVFFLFVGMLTSFCSSFAWSGYNGVSKVNFDHTHTVWSSFLHKHVTVKGPASTVNYKAIKKEPKELNDYLGSLEAVKEEDFRQFTETEKLAFLINAYNAFTVKLIVDHYPVASIKDIGNLLTSAWKIKFFNLFGEQRHLDNIEHDMIRKWFNEPRIHFAVVCASVGCPALRNEAYVPEKLDQQLEEASRNFLSDVSRNRYLAASKKLELSSIFKWYGKDFVKKFGSVEEFIALRITTNPLDQSIIKSKSAAIEYLDYNWSLNEEK